MLEYKDVLLSLVLFAGISFVVLRLATKAGFWRLYPLSSSPSLSLASIAIVFVIYLGMTTLLAPYTASMLESLYMRSHHLPPPDAFYGYLQVALLILLFLLLYLYCASLGNSVFTTLWKRRRYPASSVIADIGLGAMTWVICFPITQFVGQGLDLLLYLWTPFQGYEQVAITDLKNALNSPGLLSCMLFIIIIAAPVIEEFLFRGCLQTYLKQYLPLKGAIVLSSICFSLFHFSLSQHLGNISLCATLFILALFLGFLYERQGSLFANVSLHMTFNTISCAQILLSNPSLT